MNTPASTASAISDVIDAFEQDLLSLHLEHNEVHEWINKLRAAAPTAQPVGQKPAPMLPAGWSIRFYKSADSQEWCLGIRSPVNGELFHKCSKNEVRMAEEFASTSPAPAAPSANAPLP